MLSKRKKVKRSGDIMAALVLIITMAFVIKYGYSDNRLISISILVGAWMIADAIDNVKIAIKEIRRKT